jgi:acyl-CoA synthetase (AMP-forming)/AMP-acid ligase II
MRKVVTPSRSQVAVADGRGFSEFSEAAGYREQAGNSDAAESELTEVSNCFNLRHQRVRVLGQRVLDAMFRRDMSCVKFRRTTMSTRETFWEMFERGARDGAARVAVHFQGRNITFAELADLAIRIAGWLSQQGFQKGDRASLLLPNSPEYIAWYLGVQRAGGVVVALNPETTLLELAATLAHAAPAVVVFGPKAADVFAAATLLPELQRSAYAGGAPAMRDGVPIAVSVGLKGAVPLAAPWNLYATSDVLASRAGLPAFATQLDDLAQLIYTSGTTGRPKGVTLSHRNLAANLGSIVTYLGLTAGDSIFVTLPFFYSYGNSLLITHLAVGGRLILGDDFVFWNRALDLMGRERATGFAGVPASYAMLLHKSDFRSRRFGDLNYLTCAGGGLAPAVVEQIRAAFPELRLFLMYGQTEATARLSTLLPEELDAKPGSIGRGIPGVTLEVLDAAGNRLPPGEVGEIVARGENIMQGYWNDPEETARVLRPEGLRTGDLATTDADGYLYIVGRKSDIIKSGAYRINPKEIEEVILAVPGVAEVAVAGLPDEIWGESPVAFVVRSPGALSPSDGEILDYCRRHLPRYKQVREIRFAASLPRTASGKVRRGELRHLASSSH